MTNSSAREYGPVDLTKAHDALRRLLEVAGGVMSSEERENLRSLRKALADERVTVVEPVAEEAGNPEPTGAHALVLDHDGDRWVRSPDTGLWICVGHPASAEWTDLLRDYGPIEVVFEGA